MFASNLFTGKRPKVAQTFQTKRIKDRRPPTVYVGLSATKQTVSLVVNSFYRHLATAKLSLLGDYRQGASNPNKLTVLICHIGRQVD